MKGSVARGAGYLTRGARLLNHPSLRPFVLIPLAINVLIFGALISIGFSYMSDLMDGCCRIPDWLHFIEWILWPPSYHSESDNRLLIRSPYHRRHSMRYWLRRLRS
jgi:uncharacterized protein involved in cysteine biosynthesis